VPSFTDTTVAASTGYIYKVAAVDVSGATPVLTEYSAETETLTPTASGETDFSDAYNGLGINVPKIVNSVTYPGNGVAKSVSGIASGASTTATVTTSTAHGFSTGYVVGITGAAGANNADVNGGFYIITVLSSTTFTITKTGTNVLSLTGGTANGWQVSGAFVDDTGTNRVLGDAFSLVQFPVGQIVYSEADGKLYRNGKHPSPGAWDNYWTRASVDAIDVTSDGLVVISADKITTGTLGSISLNGGVFGVTSLGAVTASNVNITGGQLNINGNFIVNSSGDLTAYGAKFNPEGKPAVTLQGNSDEGDIAVPDGNRLDIGHTNTSTNFFQVGARMSSGRNWTFYGDVTINGNISATSGLGGTVADGSITTAKLADSAVTTAKIATDAVTSAQIAAAAVGSSEIATGAVTETELGSSAVTTVKIDALAVTTAKIADVNVTTAKIANDAVTSGKIGTNAVTYGKVNDDAIGTAAIINLAVTQEKIAAGAVTSSKIGTGEVTTSKLSQGSIGGSEFTAGTTGGVVFASWSASGTAAAFLRKGTASGVSERSWKKEIEPLPTLTDKYAELNWVKFKWDHDGVKAAGSDYKFGDNVQYGLIADEVEGILPDAILWEDHGGAMSRGVFWDYMRSVEGAVIKDLILRVKSLESKVFELENK